MKKKSRLEKNLPIQSKGTKRFSTAFVSFAACRVTTKEKTGWPRCHYPKKEEASETAGCYKKEIKEQTGSDFANEKASNKIKTSICEEYEWLIPLSQRIGADAAVT